MVRPPEMKKGADTPDPGEKSLAGRSFRERFWSDSNHRNTLLQGEPLSKNFVPKDPPEQWVQEDEPSPNLSYTPFKAQPIRQVQMKPNTPQPQPLAPPDPMFLNGHPERPQMHQRNEQILGPPPNDPNLMQQRQQIPSRAGLPPRALSAQGMYVQRRFSDTGIEQQQQQQQQQQQVWWSQQQAEAAAAHRRPEHWQEAQGMPPPRASSRATSDMGVSVIMPSRYQSYCTLPRPEMVQLGPGGGIIIDEPPPPPRPQGPEPKLRQQALTAMSEPRLPVEVKSQKMSPNAPYPVSTKSAKSNDDDGPVNWPAVLKLSILTTVIGIIVFGLGVARLVLVSKWALGIELCYGLFVALTGTLGVVAVQKRHYCSLVACYVMSGMSCILAVPPFVAGLMVTVPETFPMVERKWFVGENDQLGIDILLSALCLVQVLIGIVLASLGCMTASKTISDNENTKKRAVMEDEEKFF